MVFASDTHLTPNDPEGIARFRRFLDGPAAEAAQIILLGDLFDFWVSPIQIHEPAMRPVLGRLQELAASGVDVGFVEGNRDFAASPELRRIGVRSLPDVSAFTQAGRCVAFTHGDQLCTRDVSYQALRRVARGQTVRHLLRALPERVAMGLGRSARAGSKRQTSRKEYDVMGLTPHAVAGLLEDTDADTLVCGHVHWGRQHVLEVAGRPRDVVVLSAWEDRGSYVRVADGEVGFFWFE